MKNKNSAPVLILCLLLIVQSSPAQRFLPCWLELDSEIRYELDKLRSQGNKPVILSKREGSGSQTEFIILVGTDETENLEIAMESLSSLIKKRYDTSPPNGGVSQKRVMIMAGGLFVLSMIPLLYDALTSPDGRASFISALPAVVYGLGLSAFSSKLSGTIANYTQVVVATGSQLKEIRAQLNAHFSDNYSVSPFGVSAIVIVPKPYLADISKQLVEQSGYAVVSRPR